MSRPAPAVQATVAMTAMELRLTARRGENVLVMVVIPALVLVFFASVAILPTPGRSVDFLLPGSIGLAIIATGMVNLGIATAYERHYGVLKRLGGSPLPRIGLVAAKLLAVLVVEVADLAALLPAARLTELVRISLGEGASPLQPVVVLAVWAVAAVAVAVRTFRWE
jgi:ABC-2 type transport system permease protein